MTSMVSPAGAGRRGGAALRRRQQRRRDGGRRRDGDACSCSPKGHVVLPLRMPPGQGISGALCLTGGRPQTTDGRQARVIESPSTVISTGCQARGGRTGDAASRPRGRTVLPWHGHGISPSELDSTRQPWWVQTAEKALKSPSVGWVTTILAAATTKQPPTGTSAALASASPPPEAAPSSLGDDDSVVGLAAGGRVGGRRARSRRRTRRGAGTPTATAADPDRARRLLMAVMRPEQ